MIGQIRFPTMADKANMHYTNAVLHEVQRKGDIVPLNMSRVATKDTALGGYLVPKVRKNAFWHSFIFSKHTLLKEKFIKPKYTLFDALLIISSSTNNRLYLIYNYF